MREERSEGNCESVAEQQAGFGEGGQGERERKRGERVEEKTREGSEEDC